MKNFMIRSTLMLIFLIVFNTLFFVLSGTENVTSVWISYAFINLAYVTILCMPLFKTKGQASFYLSTTLYVQSITYFVVELVVGVIFIIWQLDAFVWPLVIQVVIWLIFMILILSNALANNYTAQALDERAQNLSVYQNNRMNLKKLLVWTNNAEIKKIIITCCDTLEASSSRQTIESKDVDCQIEQNILLLKQLLQTGDDAQSLTTAQHLHKLIEERKIMLKYSFNN